MALSQQDKRRFPRIRCATPLRYQVRGSGEFNNVLTDDISSSGVGFINDRFIAPATPIMLEINLLSNVLTPIGKVAWSEPLLHSYRYRLGIEFIEFNQRERDYLGDYIDMRMGKL